jgi:hypothetical protein
MSPPRPRPLATVGRLLRRRLRELKRSPEELAEAVELPFEYIDALLTGARQPPRPARTDVYERMTSFLRLGRRELAACVEAERADTAPTRKSGPRVPVRRLLLALCEPSTAAELERRRARRGSAEITGLSHRLLDVTQGAVRRALDDHIGLRLAAAAHGNTYAAMRLRVLDFLDATPSTLTVSALTEFVRPRIARWDVELKTGVMRVVLRPWERGSPQQKGRAPSLPAVRGVDAVT